MNLNQRTHFPGSSDTRGGGVELEGGRRNLESSFDHTTMSPAELRALYIARSAEVTPPGTSSPSGGSPSEGEGVGAATSSPSLSPYGDIMYGAQRSARGMPTGILKARVHPRTPAAATSHRSQGKKGASGKFKGKRDDEEQRVAAAKAKIAVQRAQLEQCYKTRCATKIESAARRHAADREFHQIRLRHEVDERLEAANAAVSAAEEDLTSKAAKAIAAADAAARAARALAQEDAMGGENDASSEGMHGMGGGRVQAQDSSDERRRTAAAQAAVDAKQEAEKAAQEESDARAALQAAVAAQAVAGEEAKAAAAKAKDAKAHLVREKASKVS